MRRFGRSSLHEVSISSAAATPILTTAEAKSFLKVTYSDDDTYIDTLVESATKFIEKYLNRALITQTLISYYKSYGNRVHLPMGPHQSVTSVKYIDEDNNETTLTANSDYYVRGVDDYYLDFYTATTLPAGADPNADTSEFGLKVTYIAGYGDASSDVPDAIIEAARRLVGHWYDNREEFVTENIVSKMPMGVAALLANYRKR